MKLLAFNFQRNGVGGECFYAALVQDVMETKGKFLITFETDESKDDEIVTASCRVVKLDGGNAAFYECWRGDRIGYELQHVLTKERNRTNVKRLYDLHVLYENKATHANRDVEYKEPITSSPYEMINAS